MNKTTEATGPRHVAATIAEDLVLELAAADDEGLIDLHLTRGADSVRIGGIATARATAAALHAVIGGQAGQGEISEADRAPAAAHLADLDPELPLPEYVAEGQRRAAAIDCGIPGCDKTGHRWDQDQSEWIHWLENIRAGRLEVHLAVTSQGNLEVNTYAQLDDTATEADQLLALAAELRSYASIIERQATTALELHSAAVKRAQS